MKPVNGTKDAHNKKKLAYKAQRLPIVAECLRKGMAYRKIAVYVAQVLNMDKPVSSKTIHDDIQSLLAEWRERRIKSTDLLIQERLEIIDYSIEQCLEQWEKSKTNYDETSLKQIGTATQGGTGVTPSRAEKSTTHKIVYGDPRYIAEARAQLDVKAKLLGLFPAEKKDITSKGESLSGGFYDYLRQLNQVEDDAKQE